MSELTRRSVLRASLGSGGGGALRAALYRQRAGQDRDRVVGPGLRPGGGRGLQEDGRRLREAQRQQDRLQHRAVRAAAAEDHLGDHLGRRAGPDPRSTPLEAAAAAGLGRPAGRRDRRGRDRRRRRWRRRRSPTPIATTTSTKKRSLLRRAVRRCGDAVPRLADPGREGRLQESRHAEDMGRLHRLLHPGAEEAAANWACGTPMPPPSWSARSATTRMQHVRAVPDRLWRAGHRHPGRPVPPRRPAGPGGGDQGAGQDWSSSTRKATSRRARSTGTTPTTTTRSTPSCA